MFENSLKFTTIDRFVVLNAKQLAQLTEAQAKAYNTALAAFAAAFRAKYPDGKEVLIDITGLSNRTQSVAGKSDAHVIRFETDDEFLDLNLPGGVIRKPEANADIIASNAGYPSFPVMSGMLAAAVDKGQFKVIINLHLKGEKYSVKGGAEREFTSTHITQEGFEYVPSVGTARLMERVVEKAATKHFDSMFAGKPKNAPVMDGGDSDHDADI